MFFRIVLSILTVFGLVCSVILFYVTMPWMVAQALIVRTRMIDYFRHPATFRSKDYRSVFSSAPMPHSSLPKNHTHPAAAASRSTATLFMRTVSTMLGLEPFFYQESLSNQERGFAGSRQYYWSKDVNADPSPDLPTDRNLMCLVDVDYYIDLEEFLIEHPGPVMLYTFVPDTVAGEYGDTSHTFDKDSNLEMLVAGSATHRHPLYNYGVDNIIIRYGWTTATYEVERRPVSANRYVILLSPTGRWSHIGSLFASILMGPRISRLKVAHGDFLALNVMSAKGHCTSVARVGELLCATIPTADHQALAGLDRTSKVALNLHQIISMLPKDMDENIQRRIAVCLLDYHQNAEVAKADTVFPVEYAVRRYQAHSPVLDDTSRPGMVPFMSPIIHGAFVPDDCAANDAAAIKHRIADVKSDLEIEGPSGAFVLERMHEFLERFIPEPHIGHPVGYDEVSERQPRPTQQTILMRALHTFVPQRVISMFVKREAYGDVKAPRPISTINGVDKVEYSRYIYAFADHLKTAVWYAFGLTPLYIALRVVEICVRAAFTVNTDFDKYDGRVSPVMRMLEHLALIRYFCVKYHDAIIKLHNSQFNLKGFSRYGMRYLTGTARASGSPETSSMNSLGNAFTNYVAAYLQTKDADAAYKALGLYGGDDGLTANLEPDHLVRAAELVGHKLTISPTPRGQLGVKFLSRVYSPNVCYGSPDSCADLPRQLSKFHVTTNVDPAITNEMKLVAKATGFALSDPNTPILGELSVRVMDLAFPVEAKHQDELTSIQSWNSRMPTQYPNENHAGWMDAYALEALIGFDHLRFHNWLDSCITLQDYLRAPLCCDPVPPKPKFPIYVDYHQKKSRVTARSRAYKKK